MTSKQERNIMGVVWLAVITGVISLIILALK